MGVGEGEVSSAAGGGGGAAAAASNVDEAGVLTFPKASIKRIMKLDPDTKQVAADAIIVVARAAEMFVEKLSKASHQTATANKRRTIKYEDIADARAGDRNLEFLDGVIPQI